MQNVLIVYETKHGQTEKIARFIGDRLTKTGVKVTLVKPDDLPTLPPDTFQGIITAAPVYAGKYSPKLADWLMRNKLALEVMPTAFISVCLGVLEIGNAKTQAEERDIVNRLMVSTGFAPQMWKIIAGGIPYRDYNWIIRMVMKRIAKKAGGDTDTSRNHEYTNWKELEEFSDAFARRLKLPFEAT